MQYTYIYIYNIGWALDIIKKIQIQKEMDILIPP